MAKNFFNLDEIVRKWAEEEYWNTATPSQKRLLQKQNKKKTKYLELHIDWTKTRFTDKTTWLRLGEDDQGLVGNATSEHQPPMQAQQQQLIQMGPGRSATPVTSILFETKFTNSTGKDQQYTMRTEKTTKSSMSTAVEKGLTRGFELGLTLKTPCEVVEVNAGYKREVTLTNMHGETFEEELTWGVESVIQVDKHHVAEASLVVNERKLSGAFEIESRISGTVNVTFTNIKENNAFVKVIGHDIVDIVKKHIEDAGKEDRHFPFVKLIEEGADRVVIVTTNGSCDFRYGVSQEVKVNQRPITASESQSDVTAGASIPP